MSSSDCPECGAPLAAGITRCDECLVQLDWTNGLRANHPFIRPGDPIFFLDLTCSPLPGQSERTGGFRDGSRFEASAGGSLLHVAPKRAIEVFDGKLRARDACVRAAFTVIDPLVTFSCMARVERFGGVKMKYSLEVDCATHRMRLTRGFSGSSAAAYAELTPYRPCPVLFPPGTLNVVELRAQGPTLEARVNDQHVTTVHDPVLGIGAYGFRAEAMGKAKVHQRVLASWLEVRQVVA